jgi:hypothetical protein
LSRYFEQAAQPLPKIQLPLTQLPDPTVELHWSNRQPQFASVFPCWLLVLAMPRAEQKLQAWEQEYRFSLSHMQSPKPLLRLQKK